MYMAHSPVLAASSEVFHNFFVKRIPTFIDELADRKLMLHGVRGDVLQVVLDFIYGVTPPTIEEFEKLKIGADALAIHGAYTYCGEKFYKNTAMSSGQSDDAAGRGQSVIVYSKPQSPGNGAVPTPKPKVCPVTNIQGGGINVCPVSNILEPITIESGGNAISGALMPSGATDENLSSTDVEMHPANTDVVHTDSATNVPNQVLTASNVILNKQLPNSVRITSPTDMNTCPVNTGDVTNRSLTPRDMLPVQSPAVCPFNGKPSSQGTRQDHVTPLATDIDNKKKSLESTMRSMPPVFIPDLTPIQQMTPSHVQNCCGNDSITKGTTEDISSEVSTLPEKPSLEHPHHDLIPEMTLDDLTVQLECPHLKRMASSEGSASKNANTMKAEDGVGSPASAASLDNDYSDCSSEASNLETCSADRQTKFSSSFLVCNIIDSPRSMQMCTDDASVTDRYFRHLDEVSGGKAKNLLLGRKSNDGHNDEAAVCKVEPLPDGSASGQCPEACSSENSNNSYSDTSSEVWAVRPGRPPTAEEEAENSKLMSQLKLNAKKSYTCLVDGCGYTNKHVDYMCSHMYHRHNMGMPTKHCGHCTKAYFSVG